MAFNIGDRVTTISGLEAVVTDKMYSEKKGMYYFGIQYKGMSEEESDLFEEDQLQVMEESAEYDVETDINIADGMVIVSFYETKGGNRTLAARGHGHMLRKDALGIVQATSFAARRALLSINNDSVVVGKE